MQRCSEIGGKKKNVFKSCPHPCFSLPLPAALLEISRTGCHRAEPTVRPRIPDFQVAGLARGKKLGVGQGNYGRYLTIYGNRLGRQKKKKNPKTNQTRRGFGFSCRQKRASRSSTRSMPALAVALKNKYKDICALKNQQATDGCRAGERTPLREGPC